MIIEQVEIREFGRLRDVTYDFDGRVQIISGSNESGKSTLAAFIRYMLYGFPRAAGELSEKKKRIGWEGGIAAGAMTIRLSDGHRYRVERVTTVATAAGGVRETYREVAQIVDLATGTPLPGTETAGERFLSVPEEIYRATAFVGQLDSSRVGGQEVCEAIENILFAGDESVSVPRALERLDNARRALLHKNGKGGELYELENEATELSRRLTLAKDKNADILEKEADIDKLTKQIEAAERALVVATDNERNAHNRLLAAAFDRLHEAEAQKKEAEDALRDMDGMPAYRLQENDLIDLHACRRTAEEAERAYNEARIARAGVGEPTLSDDVRAQLETAEALGGTGVIRRRARSAARLFRLSILLSVLFALFAAAGAALLILSLPFIAIPLFVAALGTAVASGVLFFLARKKRVALYTALGASDAAALTAALAAIDAATDTLGAHRTATEAATDEENAHLEAYNRALGLLDTVVRRFGTPLPSEDIYAFLDTLEDSARRLMEKKKQHDAARKNADSVIEALQLRTAGANEAAVREALPADYDVDIDKIDLEDLRKRKDFYIGQTKALAIRRTELERELYAVRSRAEDPVALEADLAQLDLRIAAARDRHRAAVMAYEALAGAGERLREEIAPTLSRFSCQLVEHLTDGKYTRMGVDNNLAVSMGVEGGSTVSVAYMSAGTQDLAYLSLRMALIDLLYREKPPVCFDESFSHLDDERASRMIELLHAMGESGQQCLLFTCHSREEEFFRAAYGTPAVIRL